MGLPRVSAEWPVNKDGSARSEVRHVQSQCATRVHAGAYTSPVITITVQTAVIVEPYGYTVELINLKTRRVFPPITVGAFPTEIGRAHV